jgi:hypothetical protein
MYIVCIEELSVWKNHWHEALPGPTPPIPHRGVEGSRRASVGKVTPPESRAPASPSGVIG